MTTLYSYPYNRRSKSEPKPSGGLTAVGETLYGLTILDRGRGTGELYRIALPSGAKTTIHSFTGCPDGAAPNGDLLSMGTGSATYLYGVTSAGGSCHTKGGVIFRVQPDGSHYRILHVFTAGKDGEHPLAGLTALDGTLYGTTFAGGARNGGTIYSLSPNGRYRVLYAFSGTKNNPGGPSASLAAVGSVLYGTTVGEAILDGNVNRGTLFANRPSDGKELDLHLFGYGLDGYYPLAPVVYWHGLLLGTTKDGGQNDLGTVFSYQLKR